MRLIDADKINFEEVFGGQSDFSKEIRASAKSLINRQPTAFDKEKVIEEINNASTTRCRYGFMNFDLSQKRCLDCQDDFIRAVYEIIEKGGIE